MEVFKKPIFLPSNMDILGLEEYKISSNWFQRENQLELVLNRQSACQSRIHAMTVI